MCKTTVYVCVRQLTRKLPSLTYTHTQTCMYTDRTVPDTPNRIKPADPPAYIGTLYYLFRLCLLPLRHSFGFHRSFHGHYPRCVNKIHVYIYVYIYTRFLYRTPVPLDDVWSGRSAVATAGNPDRREEYPVT